MSEHLGEILADIERQTSDVFKRIDLAEAEISAAMERDPANADRYNASFRLLVPTETLVSDSLYQHHCRELLERVADGQDTRPGTDAEVLGACSQATHAAPPNRTLSLAYARLFRRLYPDGAQTVDELEAAVGRERYAGDVDELIAWCRRKLTRDDRR